MMGQVSMGTQSSAIPGGFVYSAGLQPSVWRGRLFPGCRTDPRQIFTSGGMGSSGTNGKMKLLGTCWPLDDWATFDRGAISKIAIHGLAHKTSSSSACRAEGGRGRVGAGAACKQGSRIAAFHKLAEGPSKAIETFVFSPDDC